METLALSAPLWDQCLSLLETELSEQQLNTWIRPLQAHEEDGRLRIMAPNRFVLDMVQSTFLARIQELVTTIAGDPPVTVSLFIGTGVPRAVERRATAGAGAPVDDRDEGRSSAGWVDGVESTSSESRTGSQAAPERSQIAGSQPLSSRDSGLSPLFSFETLVEGKSNQFGRAAATQIGKNPGTAYNPFLIYGSSGLGKTHLMQAIGNEILSNRPNARVMYLNSERYVGEMVSALQHGRINKFKQFYRGLDALLLDDVQFFAGKDQTQEEFFHNFNALLEGGQQIVLTCDRYPKEVNGLEERLKTRFGWGLSVSVEPPELEMRVAILNSKAEQNGVELPSEVSFFIAKRVRSNVRELEGALKRVMATSQLIGKPITLDFTRETLKDLLAVQAKLVTIENIQKTVSEYYRMRQTDLTAKSRSRSIARPRQMAMALSKELTGKSLPEIGQAFGGRDHTTVLHACRKIVELQAEDSAIREDYDNLMRTLST